jgi:uncharacterized protein (DUF952 family)
VPVGSSYARQPLVTHSAPRQRIFHIARRREWEDARRVGSYAISTRDQSLDDVGFIHCSYAHQVAGTANRYYAGEPDLVLLVIDPERLAAPLRAEPPAAGAEPYPHIYGPLNTEAVVDVLPYAPSANGSFAPPPVA